MDSRGPSGAGSAPRIAVVTFLEARNHGAYLQAYALQRFLADLGFPCRLLDYSNPHMAWVYAPVHRGGLFRGRLPDDLSRVRNALLDARRNAAFRAFARRNLVLSRRRYYTLADLAAADAHYDIFLAGSDQVFSIRCSNLDTAYFLSFVSDGAKKVSYAASFGFDEIPAPYRALYRALLAPFRRLSLREESGARIVRELLGPDAPPVDVHVDPTLLLDAGAWSPIAAQSRVRVPRRYLLVYNVYRPVRLFDEAFRIARERRLPLVYLGRDLPLRDRLRRGVRVIESAAPQDFVRLFRDASCVLTNSFHGTAFSVLFRRPFLVELENRGAYNHRVAALLDRLGLRSCARGDGPGTPAGEDADWERAAALLARERARSAAYLRKALAPVPRDAPR